MSDIPINAHVHVDGKSPYVVHEPYENVISLQEINTWLTNGVTSHSKNIHTKKKIKVVKDAIRKIDFKYTGILETGDPYIQFHEYEDKTNTLKENGTLADTYTKLKILIKYDLFDPEIMTRLKEHLTYVSNRQSRRQRRIDKVTSDSKRTRKGPKLRLTEELKSLIIFKNNTHTRSVIQPGTLSSEKAFRQQYLRLVENTNDIGSALPKDNLSHIPQRHDILQAIQGQPSQSRISLVAEDPYRGDSTELSSIPLMNDHNNSDSHSSNVGSRSSNNVGSRSSNNVGSRSSNNVGSRSKKRKRE